MTDEIAQKLFDLEDHKACPFCKGHDLKLKTDFYGQDYRVKCETCESFGPLGYSPEEAMELWDKRD